MNWISSYCEINREITAYRLVQAKTTWAYLFILILLATNLLKHACIPRAITAKTIKYYRLLMFYLNNILNFFIAIIAVLIINGCSSADNTDKHYQSVKVERVDDRKINNERQFPGEVRARHETTLSFRVSGKLVERAVDLGDQVRKGQLLARLDANDHELNRQNLAAQHTAAEADFKFKNAELPAYRDLLEQNIISQTEFDRHQTDSITARQRLAALKAQLEQAANQLAYTKLLADRDGVVTGLEAETGQNLAAGSAFLKLAPLDEREIAIDVPEQLASKLKVNQAVEAALWSEANQRLKARIREIAASANPASRTYSVKVALLEGKNAARLGMTATVWIKFDSNSQLTIPLSAVFTPQNQPNQPHVWLVNECDFAIAAKPVQVGEVIAGDRVAVTGLSAGQLLVSAGAQHLVDGQVVRLPQTYPGC